MFLIDDILFAPFKGLWYIAREIYSQAWKQLFDEETIQKQLAALQFEYELGNIPKEEFDRQEAALLDRLRLARDVRISRAADQGEEE